VKDTLQESSYMDSFHSQLDQKLEELEEKICSAKQSLKKSQSDGEADDAIKSLKKS
jgi:hypothetical protein